MQHKVAAYQVPRQTILWIRSRTTIDGLPQMIAGSFAGIYGATGRLHAKPTGDPFVMYHAFAPDGIDAEACVPVDRTDEPFEPVRARSLPAGLVARTLHVGPYDEIGAAYDALNAWISADAYQAAGPFRERYLNGPPDAAPEAYRTEVEVAVDPVQELVESGIAFG